MKIKKVFMLLILVLTLFVPRGGWSAEPKKLSPQQLRLSQDIAAGMPLSNVIINAKNEGLNLREIVVPLLEAQVDPAMIVYAAISGGYSAEQVIEDTIAAAKVSTQRVETIVQQIVQAAVIAGANTSAISSGAIEAGVSAPVVSNAIANTTAPGEPVFGFTPPPSPVRSIVPESRIIIGGGGGATPAIEKDDDKIKKCKKEHYKDKKGKGSPCEPRR